MGGPAGGAAVEVEDGIDEAGGAGMVTGSGGGSGGGATCGTVVRAGVCREGMAKGAGGWLSQRGVGGGVRWRGGGGGAGTEEGSTLEEGGAGVCRGGGEGEGRVGSVSEEKGVMEVVEGKDEGGGKGHVGGRGSGGGWKRCVVGRIEEGVEEDSIVGGGIEGGGEMGEDRKAVREWNR